MYVDEIGDHSLKSIKDPFNKYLSLTGIIIQLDHSANLLHPSFEEIKNKFFPHHSKENPVIFHRTDIVSKRKDFSCLLDDNLRADFDHNLLQAMVKIDFEVVNVLIDKESFDKKYTKWKMDTYHYCMRCLVERYHRHLYSKRGVGDIMFESRDPNADKKLTKSYKKIYYSGTENVLAKHLHTTLTSNELKMSKKKANVSGIQLADLLAYPARRFMLNHYNIQPIEKVVHSDAIIERVLKPKLRNLNGKIEGIGIKLLP